MREGVSRKTCKGDADGGGGRAKGKTKAGRHSRTPSEIWPPLDIPEKNRDFLS